MKDSKDPKDPKAHKNFHQQILRLRLLPPTEQVDKKFIRRVQHFFGRPMTGVVDDELLDLVKPKHFRRWAKYVRGDKNKVRVRGHKGGEMVVFRGRP